MNLLLLMPKGMSLKRLDELGHLSRELPVHQRLSESIGHIYIYSYGKNEQKFIKDYLNITVLSKFRFIPDWDFLPGKIIGFLTYVYNFMSIVFRWNIFSKIDFIKTSQFRGTGWGIILKKIFKVKLFIRMGYYHTLDKKCFKLNKDYLKSIKLEERYFKRADRIIVTNTKAKKFISKRYKIKENLISYIPNYIDTEIFKTQNIKKEYDIIFVGRLHEVKNLQNLLEAIKGLSLNSLFVGKGPLKNKILDFSKSNNIKLEIIDRIDNVYLPKYYNQSKIFVLPSLYEGNPKVLLEAMACGCAVIGTNVFGINNIIEHKVNGYLCDTDKDSIKRAIMDVINDKSLRKSIGKNARKFIEENYALEKLWNEELELYK